MSRVKLGTFIESYGDGLHGTPTYDEHGEYYFINGNNLINGAISIDNDTLRVSKSEYERIKRPLGEKAVLLSINGTLGRVAEYKGEKIALGKSACYINIKSDANKDFVKYIMMTQEFQKYILLVAHGSTIKNLAPSQVTDYEFSLPENADVDRIASILSTIDNKIKINNKINAELEAMAKTIYDYWFLQYDFPNEKGKPYKTSGGRMVWNEELKREIPEGWEVKELKKMITSNRGISYNTATISGGGVPMINLASFNVDGSYKHKGIKSYNGNYPANKILHPYDLVMCNTQQTAIDLSKDIIGKAFLVPDIFDGDVVSSHHVTTINVQQDILKYWLCYLFNTSYFHKYVAGYASGTNILGLTFSGVEKYQTEVPNNLILKQFAKIAKDVETKKSILIKENQVLASLRDFLLPLLMNGQVTFKGKNFSPEC